jgi:hypothetical protein
MGKDWLWHVDNDHWAVWREAANRYGFNNELAKAARVLEEMESMTPECFESYSANLYRDTN